MQNNMEAERVIFRLEYDDYRQGETIIACFPDEEANPGRIAAVPFYFNHELGLVYFEPYTEIELGYYYDTKPLKDVNLVEKCVWELENRYQTKFRIAHRR